MYYKEFVQMMSVSYFGLKILFSFLRRLYKDGINNIDIHSPFLCFLNFFFVHVLHLSSLLMIAQLELAGDGYLIKLLSPSVS